MSNRPLISVIIPIYNSSKKILNLLSQLRGQSFKRFEVILINDCSTDNTKILIEDELIKKRDPRFRLISLKENRGVSYARNVGIINSKGKYIIFIDSDDYIDSNMLYEYLNRILKNNTDIEFFSMIRRTTGEKYPHYSQKFIGKIVDQRTLIMMYGNQQLTGFPFLYISKKELWEDTNTSFNSCYSYQEDSLALLELIINSPEIKAGFNNLSFYTYNDNNDSSKLNNLKLDDYKQAVKIDELILLKVKEKFNNSIVCSYILAHQLSNLINLIAFTIKNNSKLEYESARKKFIKIYLIAEENLRLRLKRKIQFYLLKYNCISILRCLSKRKIK